jgi:hypothetical protein
MRVECYKFEDDKLNDIGIILFAIHFLPDSEDKQNFTLLDLLILEVAQENIVFLGYFWLDDQGNYGTFIMMNQKLRNLRQDVSLQCLQEEISDLRHISEFDFKLIV